jgi:hypothetical protein
VDPAPLGGFVSADGSNAARPEHPKRPELGYLHEEIGSHGDGKPQTRGDQVDVQAALVHLASREIANVGAKAAFDTVKSVCGFRVFNI